MIYWEQIEFNYYNTVVFGVGEVLWESHELIRVSICEEEPSTSVSADWTES